jgi:hypothetical protein
MSMYSTSSQSADQVKNYLKNLHLTTDSNPRTWLEVKNSLSDTIQLEHLSLIEPEHYPFIDWFKVVSRLDLQPTLYNESTILPYQLECALGYHELMKNGRMVNFLSPIELLSTIQLEDVKNDKLNLLWMYIRINPCNCSPLLNNPSLEVIQAVIQLLKDKNIQYNLNKYNEMNISPAGLQYLELNGVEYDEESIAYTTQNIETFKYLSSHYCGSSELDYNNWYGYLNSSHESDDRDIVSIVIFLYPQWLIELFECEYPERFPVLWIVDKYPILAHQLVEHGCRLSLNDIEGSGLVMVDDFTNAINVKLTLDTIQFLKSHDYRFNPEVEGELNYYVNNYLNNSLIGPYLIELVPGYQLQERILSYEVNIQSLESNISRIEELCPHSIEMSEWKNHIRALIDSRLGLSRYNHSDLRAWAKPQVQLLNGLIKFFTPLTENERELFKKMIIDLFPDKKDELLSKHNLNA